MAPLPAPAQLVALLYRADWTRLCFSARLRERDDWELRNRLDAQRAERLRPPGTPPAWWPGRWLAREDGPGEPGNAGPEETGPEEAGPREGTGSLLVAPGGRWRLERVTAGERFLSVCDGDADYDIGSAAGTAERTPAGGPPLSIATLLQPAGLLARFELRLAGEEETGGRRVYRVTGTARPGAGGYHGERDRALDHAAMLVDAGLGILLRYEEIAAGRQLAMTALTDLVVDPPEAADPERFRPPPGSSVTGGRRGPRHNVTLPGLPGQAARAAAGLVSSAAAFGIRQLGSGRPPAGEPMPAPGSPPPGAWRPAGDDLISLLHRTGLPPQEFRAEVHHWENPRALLAGTEQLRASLPPALDGLLGTDAVWDALAAGEPGLTHEVTPVQVALPGRFRIGYPAGPRRARPLTLTCDGERLWWVYPDRIAAGPPQPFLFPYRHLADLGWLLTGYELQTAGGVAMAGRPGHWLRFVHQVPRRGYRSRDLDGPLPVLGPGHTELVADAALGIAVRMICYRDDQPAACYELRNLTAGTDPAAFSVTVPPGMRVEDSSMFGELCRAVTPAAAAKAAVGLGLAGAAALAGWLQKRPSGRDTPR